MPPKKKTKKKKQVESEEGSLDASVGALVDKIVES